MKSLFVSLGLAVALCGSARAQTDTLNGIAVIVNDSVITFKDVNNFIAGDVELLQRLYGRQPEVFEQKYLALRRDGIETLVERRLILDEFKSSGYPESLLDDAVEKSVKSDIRDNYGNSRMTLTKTLNASGLTEERYKQQVRERIIIRAMGDKNVRDEIVISPHKVEVFYAEHQDQFKLEDQIKLRMIVLNKPRTGNADGVRKLAEEILAKIKEGALFAEMASVYSDGSQRAEGGDWKWVERSVLRKELADVAFKLPKGGRSDVIDTPESIYLMLVEDVRPAHVRPLSEVREEIEKTLIGQEQTRLRKKWTEKLKTKAFVRYF